MLIAGIRCMLVHIYSPYVANNVFTVHQCSLQIMHTNKRERDNVTYLM